MRGMSKKAKRILGIILAILFAVGFLVGFMAIGSAKYGWATSVLIVLGVSAGVGIFVALVRFIVWLILGD